MNKLKLTGKIFGTIMSVALIISTFYLLFKAIFCGDEECYILYCIGLSATGSAMLISIFAINLIESLWKKKENKDEKRK